MTDLNFQPIEFTAWPKTPRLYRDMTITEKIDGTNGAVVITRYLGNEDPTDHLAELNAVAMVKHDNQVFLVSAQSRKRMLTHGNDNFGFGQWVKENAFGLVVNLGEGTHYGEWWGSGIQRRYDLSGPSNKRFSLFNVHRYAGIVRNNALTDDRNEAWVPNLRVVPILAEHTYSDDVIRETLRSLENNGSVAEPGFRNPEGIIVFHSASRQVYKVLIENDDQPKGLVA